MTDPSGDSPGDRAGNVPGARAGDAAGDAAAPTGLVSYLDALATTVLSPEFRVRIADRERRGEYPFSVQNIYRVLLAAAPVLYHGWMTAAGTQPLDPADPRLGTSLRCFRYLHGVLAGTAAPDRAAAARLDPIAARAMRIAGVPACFCPPGRTAHGRAWDAAPEVALRLAAVLRQYADTRWLGQHDQGFVGSPPVRDRDGAIVYARCFGRLPAAIGHENLVVTVAYAAGDADQMSFDAFRGELVDPPPRSAVVRASVDDPAAGSGPGPDAQALILRRALAALRDAAGERPDVDRGTVVVAGLFSRELSDVARARGLDPKPWLSAIVDRLPESVPAGTTSLTETYLDALASSVHRWRGALCGGD